MTALLHVITRASPLSSALETTNVEGSEGGCGCGSAAAPKKGEDELLFAMMFDVLFVMFEWFHMVLQYFYAVDQVVFGPF